MSIRVALHHKTSYRYDRLVHLSPQVVRLRPAPHSRTPILSYSLKISPADHFLNWQQDLHGNYLARLVFPNQTREFSVEVDLVADMTIINPFDFFVESYAEKIPFQYDASLNNETAPYLEVELVGPKLAEYLATIDRMPRATNDFLVDVNRDLQRHIDYTIRLEPGVQSCEETLTLRSGSCRDTSWLLVQILRNLGLAARFVSGYLIQLTPDEKSLDGPSGTEIDFTDLHAWAEVYIPGAGWIGLDPTSGLLAGEGHIPLACTPHPTTAAPITGGVSESECEFGFEMSVTRIHEDPRVTKPYTDDQWRRIEALGHDVDRLLHEGDVRLTMGGEPTFVSMDDMDGEEWNFTASSPNKRRLANQLLVRLRDRFGKNGLLHYGQGKWYPGESLPRWAFSCYWRRDGEPIWNDPSLYAEMGVQYGYGKHEAETFSAALAERLGVGAKWTIPAYEDVWHYLLQEKRLPVNVDPLKCDLDDPEERRRLARIFEQGLGETVGYVLPIERMWVGGQLRWVSGSWRVRRDQFYLLPGDSPIGYRLPMMSLPWLAEGERRPVLEVDPFAPRAPLPARAALSQAAAQLVPAYASAEARERALHPAGMPYGADYGYAGQGGAGGNGWGDGGNGHAGENGAAQYRWAAPNDQIAEQGDAYVRTALCVEPREGRLHVFMPPTHRLEDYLDLVTAVEDTAQTLRTPVTIEGYLPPSDHRLNHFRVTPDPGVIEVNVHPAHSWDELVDITTGVYEDARYSRLRTDKFDLDGRHTGTGGGNHVVVGGQTPADSPFLRRPDLLKSLLGYWHNHPSLSYLFSGKFIGPTSQAPRVDEGRRDAIYELQIAFDQIPDKTHVAPWLVDRVFRDLLIDGTGNTHRAEFCIDKLFSPDSSTGRLGLVEFRGFEMPPHAQMSLAQTLLLRSLIARFWNQPYQAKLVDWDTTLHDRFLLPHFALQDFEDVIADTREAGIPIEREWFLPHFEFRFPVLGTTAQRGIFLELREAIEPWYVLGEESAGGGMARNVDSSVERLQVKVQGMPRGRYVVTCNGRKVPLHPTGAQGEFVAGVRYRAWQPPRCLHPTIAVHSPLTFDILDTWNERSLGGCQYHVVHPGGRSHEVFPINAYEAEGRRGARFTVLGHTGGRVLPPLDEPNADFPLILDLRRGEGR